MKKSIITALLFFAIVHKDFGQSVQASIGLGSTSNSMRIYLLPTVTATPAVFSTLQFNVAIPNTISPVPTLTVVSQAFTGVTWIIDPAYNEDGFWNYNIYTASAGYTLNVTTGTEFTALELAFAGGPPGSFLNTAHISCLGSGGTVTGNGYFFCSGTLNSNSTGLGLFYDRDGAGSAVVVQNNDSYTGSGLPALSYARFAPGIILPVTFTKYDVKCNDKGAVLTWSTATEQNSNRFEIQRSTNGTDWITIDNVAAAGNSDVLRNYQYVDLNGGTAFYRIRQVDNDGRFVYTAVKGTNCKVGQFDVTLYPVPTRDKLNVVIKSDKAVRTDLQVVDVSGRIVNRTTTQVNKGNNNIVLNLDHLPAGQYMLVSSDPAITINKKFTIIR